MQVEKHTKECITNNEKPHTHKNQTPLLNTTCKKDKKLVVIQKILLGVTITYNLGNEEQWRLIKVSTTYRWYKVNPWEDHDVER